MPVRRGQPITVIFNRSRLEGTIHEVKRGRVTIRFTSPDGNAYLSVTQSRIEEGPRGLSVKI